MPVPPPQVVGMPAGSARDSAILRQQENGELLNTLNQIGKGRKKRKGGAAQIVVPVIKPLYTETVSGGQSTISTTKALVSNSNQNVANSVNDSKVAPVAPIPPNQLKGGKLIHQGQTWPCYSGGKKIKSKKNNKRKTSKRRKTSKKRKSRKLKNKE
jgi:hypothetical protein